jgi:hypothetical protein
VWERLSLFNQEEKMSLTIGTNTWISLEDANTYFDTRLNSDEWDESSSETKVKALVTAFNKISNADFDLPDEATTAMEQAQCEMALFLLLHQADMDTRMGLQAQGVKSAGIVQESYGDNVSGFPKVVEDLLKSVKKSSAYFAEIEREE